ncbi:MAG: DUF4097 domain-containing protein [Actinomycetota bacterium]|nr:DUF4097 domain-containing protein [Actinomycetota bacterium]
MRHESFETPGPVKLDLSLAEGRIDIETVEGTTTEVELDARGPEDEVRDLLEDSRIELRDRRGGHEVIVDVRNKRRFGFLSSGVDVRLTVRAPHGADVSVETAAADTRGRGRFGSLEARTASGDVELDEVGGDLSAKTASGDVSVHSVGGNASVNTASGDVELGRVEGETSAKTASGDVVVREAGPGVNVATASGDLRIEAVAEGAVTLQSASGDIDVGIRQGSNVWVDARAMSGDTRSELELGDDPPADDAPLVELRATSMSGDVTVSRATRAELTQ